MFWDVWKKNGGIRRWRGSEKSDSSKSSNSAYGKLLSTPESIVDADAPKKSVSQPVNLSQYSTNNYPNGVIQAPVDESQNNKNQDQTKITTDNPKSVRRSFSSFFPFASCTSSVASSSLKSTSAESYSKPSQNGNEVTFPLSPDSNENVSLETSNTNPNTYTWEDSESIDFPTCDVCAREFPSIRQLAAHQRKKRHYGCIECDSIFPSREVLEYHREQMCHYEFATDMYDVTEEDLNDGDFYDSDEESRVPCRDENIQDWDEEMQRLI